MPTERRRAARLLLVAVLVACAGLSGCSEPSSQVSTSNDGVPLTLPDGAVIHAEVVSTPAEQQRGLMFRRSLAPDRGMLFNFSTEEARPFWMFQTLIPLDIIWMDPNGVIVEVSADTPPCGSSNPADCPNYGGTVPSQFVLELAAGQAAAHGVKVGARIQF